MGAGLFITTVVIGTVLLVTKSRNYNIGRFVGDLSGVYVVSL